MRKVEDLLGNEIHVGDMVVWPHMTSTRNGTLEYGEVIKMEECPTITKVTCKVLQSGVKYHVGWEQTFHLPSYYPKLIKVSS